MLSRHVSRLLLSSLLVLISVIAHPADEAPAATQPFPTLDTGMHTAMINRFAVDRASRYGVSASNDKTARVWDLRDGSLVRTLRVPVGPDDEGKLYAVAIRPDGATVAVSGFTGRYSGEHSVFFYDRTNGRLIGRIADLPNVVNHLAWSPDGQRLAIALGEANGIRIYTSNPPYTEVGRDADYGGSSYSVDFDHSGRLVSTAHDGKLRLYDQALRHIVPPRASNGGDAPSVARFSQDGTRIAVGFTDSNAVRIISGRDLGPLIRLNTDTGDNGDLSSVAWSADGRRVFAAGRNDAPNGQNLIHIFDPDSGREQAVWPVSTDTVMTLQPLADGRLLFAAADPAWGIVDDTGRVGLLQEPTKGDHRGNFNGIRLAANAERMAFVHEIWRNGSWHRSNRLFDWRNLRLERAEPSPDLRQPRRDGLKIEGWNGTPRVHLNGQPLPLLPNEESFSIAVSADAKRFALGTNWQLRWFDDTGEQQWARPLPSTAWLVNLSADGRFVVAALGDGTIRWYRTTDGSEALALFVHADGERWVAWTPEGFFAASSPEAEQLFGYTLNQGRDRAAEYVSSAQLREQFYRPALLVARIDGNEAAIDAALSKVGNIRQVLARGLAPELGDLTVTPIGEGQYELRMVVNPRSGGLGRASIRVNGVEQAASRELPVGGTFNQRLRFQPGQVKLEVGFYAAGNTVLSQTRSIEIHVPEPRIVPLRKPRLHVVAVGVSQYYDPSLRDGVSYAAEDARAVVDTLLHHRDEALVELADPTLLTDMDATRERIVSALRKVAHSAQQEDVLVLYLAGHGTQDDKGDYFFQPYEAKYSSRTALLTQSLSGKQLRELLAQVKTGKAVVLLDTCASGKFYLAAAPSGRDPASKEAIARFASLSGRTVIAAAAGQAREHASLGHGLFTDALLRGLRGAAASNDGRVMVSALADFVEEDVEKNAKRLFGDPQITQREVVPGFRNFALSRRR